MLAFDDAGNQLDSMPLSNLPDFGNSLGEVVAGDDGFLYVSAGPTYKVDPSDYSVVWRVEYGGPPRVVRNGLVWSRETNIVALDTTNGELVHEINVDPGLILYGSMDVSPGGQVAVASSLGTFVMFEGGTHWQSDQPENTGWVESSFVAFIGDRVISVPRYLYASGFVGANVVWNWGFDPPPDMPSFFGRPFAGASANGDHLVIASDLLFGDGVPVIAWVDPNTGAILRWVEGPPYIDGIQCDSEGNVFVASEGSLVSYFPYAPVPGGGPLWVTEFPWEQVNATALIEGSGPPPPAPMFWERRVNAIEIP